MSMQQQQLVLLNPAPAPGPRVAARYPICGRKRLVDEPWLFVRAWDDSTHVGAA